MGTDGLLTFFSLSSRSALIRDLVLTRPQTPYPSRRLSFSLNLVLSLLLNQEPGREASERTTALFALPKDGSMLLDEGPRTAIPLFMIFSEDGEHLSILLSKCYNDVKEVSMPDRSLDWFRQAERDLEHSRESSVNKKHEWACFAAQQAAEKAMRALHLSLGQEAWGHMVSKLMQELPDSILLPGELLDKARILDNYYIPARYPNGHPEGSPFEFFGQKQSEEAIAYASEIIEFAGNEMARQKGSS